MRTGNSEIFPLLCFVFIFLFIFEIPVSAFSENLLLRSHAYNDSDNHRDQIFILVTLSLIASSWQEPGGIFERRGHNVAAVLIENQNDTILAYGLNRNFEKNSAIEHAELNLLRKATERIKNKEYWKKFSDCTLYCSLEPCPMCAGAMLIAGIPRIVFGQKSKDFNGLASQLYQKYRPDWPGVSQAAHPLVVKLDGMYAMYKKSGGSSVTRFLEMEKIRDEIFKRSEIELLHMEATDSRNQILLDRVRKYIRDFKKSE